MTTPTNLEKLFVGIFDRKRRIIEKLKHQKQLYDQRLVSKLLIDGITPPPWLLESRVIPHNSSNSDPKELNKEELISGLLLSHPHSSVTHRNSAGFFYHRTASLHADGEKPVDFCYGASASSKYSNENEARIHPQARGISTMHTLADIPASPQDLVEAKETDICNEADQSLARLTRSRSRPKALDIQNSAKASGKSRLAQESGLELCFDDTACQLDGERLNECSGLDKSNDIPASPQDLADAKELDICDETNKSLLNITRSRSRQKALELRNSAKARGKSLLAQESGIGLCFDDTPCHGEQGKTGHCLSMENRFDARSGSISRLRDDVTKETIHCHQDKGDKEIIYSGRMTRSRSNIQQSIDGNHWITQMQNNINSGGATKYRSCDAKLEEIKGPLHKKRKTEHQMLSRKCHSLTLEVNPFHKTSEDSPDRSPVGLGDHYALLQKQCPSQSSGSVSRLRDDVTQETIHCHQDKGDKEIIYSGRMTRSRSNIQQSIDGNHGITQVQIDVNSGGATKYHSCDAKLEEIKGPLHKKRKTEHQMLSRKCHSLTLEVSPFQKTSEDTPDRSPVGLGDHYALLQKQCPSQSSGSVSRLMDDVTQETIHCHQDKGDKEIIYSGRMTSSRSNIQQSIDGNHGITQVQNDVNSGGATKYHSCDAKLEEIKGPLHKKRKTEHQMLSRKCHSLTLEVNPFQKTSEDTPDRSPGGLGDHYALLQKQCPSQSLGDGQSSPSNNSAKEMHQSVEGSSSVLPKFAPERPYLESEVILEHRSGSIPEMENFAKGSMITMAESAAARHSLQCVADSAHRSGGMIPSTFEHDKFVLSSISYTSQQISVDSQGQSLSGIGKVGTDPSNLLRSPGLQCEDLLCGDKVEASAEKLGTSDVSYTSQQISIDSQGQSLSGVGEMGTYPSNSVRSLGMPCDGLLCRDKIETGVEKLGTSDVTLLSEINGSRATKVGNCDAELDETEDSQCKMRMTGHQMNRDNSSLTLKVGSFHETNENSSNRSSGGLEAHYGSLQKHFTPHSGPGQSSPSNIFMKEMHRNVKGSSTILPKSAPDGFCIKGIVYSGHRSSGMTSPTCELEKFMFSSMSGMSQHISVDSQGQSPLGVGKDPSNVLVSSGMQCDDLLCEDKAETDAEMMHTSDVTMIPVEPLQKEASVDSSVAAPDTLHVPVVGNEETMPVLPRFIVDDQENVKEFFEHRNSTGLSTPLSQLSIPFKDKLVAGVSHSVPNRHMVHIEGRNTLNANVDFALGGKSYSECFLFPSARSDWDFSKPYMSPIGKGFEGLTSTSGGSDKLGNSNPELTCFPIEEDPEISEEVFNADEVSEACDAEVCSGVGKKIREPFCDITAENARALASDIGAKRESLDSVSTEINLIETCKMANQNLGNKERKSWEKKLGKEDSSLSLGANSVKKHTGSLKTRSSKPKLLEKASLRMRNQSLTEKEPKHNNIVSNVKSFIPLVQKNQAAAVPGKRDVKVKALEAAEAAKRLAEKRENERKQKKEASKLERARIQQVNLKRLELERKSKEEEQKKKEADAATRKRQREEEERKERERKRKRLEEARKQQREQGGKNHVEKEQSRHGKAEVMDIDMVGISTPIRDEDDNSVIQEVKEQSYDISPYQCSDGEEEENEEDDIENRKFIPAWASKSCVALAISSQMQDPDSIFPPGSFRSLDEVLVPRRLQSKS